MEPRYIMVFQKEEGLTEFNNQTSNDWQRTHITITHFCMTATNPACLGGIRKEGRVGYSPVILWPDLPLIATEPFSSPII